MQNKRNEGGYIFPIVLLILSALIVIGGVVLVMMEVYKDDGYTANTNTYRNTNVYANTPGGAGSGSAGNTNAYTNVNTAATTNTEANTNSLVNADTSNVSADWITYENPIYGYHVKYPLDWNVEGGTYLFTNRVDLPWIDNTDTDKPYAEPGDESVRFTIYTNIGENFDAWFTANAEYTEQKKQETLQNMGGTLAENDLSFSHTKTTSTVNGSPAYIQTVACLKECAPDGPAFTTKTHYIQDPSNPQRIFEIQAATPTGAQANALLTTFDEMMKTFGIQE